MFHGNAFRSCMMMLVASAMIGEPSTLAGTEPSTSLSQELNTYVLLTNGRLLEGYVIRSESGYRVQMNNGIAIIIPPHEVDLHCATSAELFEHLRINTDPNNVSEQIDLFRWCCRYGLRSESEWQLQRIQRLTGDARTIQQLRTELDSRFNSRPAFAERSVSFEEEQMIEVESTDGLGTRDQIELARASLVGDGFRHFASDIQAKLINGCTASGCHNSADTIMPLSFISRGRPVTRRMTEHNLFQVLKFVDRTSPDESLILRMAATRHGHKNDEQAEPAGSNNGAHNDVWEPDSNHYRNLRSWLFLIADQEALKAKRLAELASKDSVASATQSRRPNINPQPFDRRPLPEPPTPVDPLSVESFKSTDPFDPEIFNRYLRQRNVPKETDPTTLDAVAPADSRENPGAVRNEFTDFPK